MPKEHKKYWLKKYPSSGFTLGQFIFKRYWKSSLIWAFFFGVTVASSAIGYISAYPTIASRIILAASFGNNAGFKALLGTPYHLETIPGFTMWRSLGFDTLVGAIWGLLISTSIFRGEEEAGRLELMRSGQTTGRRAAANLMFGCAAVLAGMYVLLAVITLAVGHDAKVAFSTGSSLFFAFCLLLSAMEFMAVGAFVSQLVSLRGRAAGISAVIFAVFFGVRALGDASSTMGWLVSWSPLGWIEKLQPLTNPQPLWLIPIALFVGILTLATLYIAGKRDLGASVFRTKDTARSRFYLLGSSFGITLRQNISSFIAWLFGLSLTVFAFSAAAKAAGTAFSDSPGFSKVLNKLTQASLQVAGSKTFLGIVFLIAVTILLVFVTSYVGGLREEEASGRLDNILVRAVSRETWLDSATVIGIVVIVLYGLAAGAVSLLASNLQHTGIASSDLLYAGVNIVGPAVFLLGLGILTMAVIPRITTALLYTVIAWSFFMQIVGTLLNLGAWIQDTSLFHYITLAPVVPPDWRQWAGLCVTGLVLCALGIIIFARRDIINE